MTASTSRLSGLSILLSLLIGTCMPAATGPAQHLVTEYGTFTAGKSDTETIGTNNATINGAIVQLGKAGGGTIRLPAGTFFIGPDPSKSDRAITISYSNVAIIGAGVGKTILRTNGTWDKKQLRRGSGIFVEGNGPLNNITLKDFELDGQAGWTGQYNWPATPATGDGWDIFHKGIAFVVGGNLDNVLLENLYVHHYRGEVLYVGGMSVGKMTVRNVKVTDTNASDFNLYAADLLVEKCEFGGPSRFWAELLARPNQGGYAANRMVFRNNKFWNAVDKGINVPQIAICQGDFKTYSMTFENNEIRDCPHLFGFYKGVAGPITIKNNKITNCGTVVQFGYSGGWINSDMNAKITVEDNTINRGGCLVAFSRNRAEDVLVRNNRFTGKSANDSTAVIVEDGAAITKTSVENNTFKNCRAPEQGDRVVGERPLFKNNAYAGGVQTITITSASQIIAPDCEEVKINTNADNTMAALATDGYADGQLLKITGGAPAKRVRFAPGQASYSTTSDQYLDGVTTLLFRYDGRTKKWQAVTRGAAL